jgi:hypothetical protein
MVSIHVFTGFNPRLHRKNDIASKKEKMGKEYMSQ